jgi:hypothetical protein
MSWLLTRLSEPSTWAGLAAVAIAIGTAFPVTAVVTAPIAAVCGTIAAARKG